MRKRLLATLLALCMTLTLLPGRAWATEGVEDKSESYDTAEMQPDDLTAPSEDAEGESDGEPAIDEVADTDDIIPLADTPTYGTYGSLSYAIKDGAVTITDCKHDAESVSIPPSIDGFPVTSIGDDAFDLCSNLISVSIPNSITSIGAWAFNSCTGLTNIAIPNSVTTIGSGAFNSCVGLTDVTIPDSVTYIGYAAFAHCSGLTKVIVPNSVTSLYKVGNLLGVFADCIGLTTAGPIGGGYSYEFGWTESIPASAFADCNSLISVTIPDGITTLGYGAFENCDKLEKLTVPASLDSISTDAFVGCTSLTTAGPIGGGYSYEFGWSESIPDNAFRNCGNLTRVTMPNSITAIGESVFYECSSLAEMDIPGSVTQIGKSAFSRCTDLTNVTIPYGVTQIMSHTFSGCSNLANVTIPASVISIGDSAFRDCANLTSINIPSSVKAISSYAFSGCENLSKLVVPSSVESFGTYGDPSGPFSSGHSNSLSTAGPIGGEYDFEFGWTREIPDYAFDGCQNLTSIIIPDTIVSIGSRAFSNCGSLLGITIPAPVCLIGHNAFDNSPSLKSIEVNTENRYFSSQDGVLYNNDKTQLIRYPEGKTEPFYEVLDSVTTIGSGAFRICVNLTSIAIPDSVTDIGIWAFDGCSSLSDVYYAGSEAQWKEISIGDYNTDLTSATIHYNSSGPGTGGIEEDPAPDKPDHPDQPVQDTDDSVTPHTIAFYSGISQKSVPIDIEWGWRLLLYGYSSWYENSLAVAGLALSGAAEYWDVSAEWTLRNLGFNTVASYNYDKNLFDWYHPGVTLGYQKIICGGETRHMFAVVVRGSTDPEDWISDSFADGFYQSGISVYAQLQDFIEQECGLTYNEIKNNSRFFVTGHSLGGAAANVAAQFLNISYGRDNVFAYTFASPKNVSDKSETELRAENNIFNILNSEDWITTNWHPGNTGRYGQDMQFSRISSIPWGFNTHFQTLTGKKFNNDSAHAIEVYMAYLMTRSSLAGKKAVVIHVFCPVDVEVYTPTGQLAGSITDNVVGDAIEGKVYIYIENDEKYLYLLDDDEYTIKLTGTDDGTMTYAVQNIDAEMGEAAVEQVFENVVLASGKQFASEVKVEGGIAAGVETQEVRLYVLDGDGEPEKEVLPDGSGTEIPIDRPPAPARTYTVTVNGGRGGGDYEIGEDVTITAIVPDGRRFTGWIVEEGDVTLADPYSEVTTFTMPAGDVTVTAAWAHNSDIFDGDNWYLPVDSTTPATYRVTVPDTPGGSVSVSLARAEKGDTVTITVTPDSGYRLDELSVLDRRGNGLELTDKGDGKYAFAMPGSAVTVSAVFRLMEHEPAAPVVPDWTNPFADVSVSAWYYDAVKFVSGNGLMNGLDSTVFAPDANLSRAELAQILYNKEGKPAVSGGSAFTDTAAGAWYADAVTWAAAKNIVGGYGNGLFGPDDNITREQLAAMLWRYAGEPMSVREISFSDADQISGFARAAVRWAVENGVLNGKGSSILDPRGFATRAEAAQMLKNYLDS